MKDSRFEILGGNNVDIPFSMSQFLDHLQHFGESDRPLLMVHVALDSDLEQMTKYLSYYHKLEKIRQRDPLAHAAIIQRLNGSVNAQWLCPAMNNLHVHRLLRYTPGRQFNNVAEMVHSFLTGRNKSVETVESQMQGRRNGQAHLPKDYAVDKDGLKIALRAATAAMIASNITIANQMGVQGPALQPGPAPLPDAPPFSRDMATAISTAIVRALSITYTSEAGAQAAATAAALYVATHPAPLQNGQSGPLDPIVLADADHAAINAALLVPPPPPVPLVRPPIPPPAAAANLPLMEMYTDAQINDIFTQIGPQLLPSLQMELFTANELDAENDNVTVRLVAL